MYRFINQAVDRFNNKSSILIESPLIPNIGNCAEEMFFGLLKAQRERKRVLFLFLLHPLFWKFTVPVANRELLHVESKHVASNSSWYGLLSGMLLTVTYSLMRVVYVVWRSVNLRRMIRLIRPKIQIIAPTDDNYRVPAIGRSALWQPEGVVNFSWEIVEDYKWREQFKRYQPPSINKNKYRFAENLRVAMGIPIDEWFVCLHVRETKNLKDSAYRDAAIQNYVEGIKAITNTGGWVVRIGDASMTPLPQMDRVIDYPHTRYKSELSDLYLISQCRFFFGTTSGPLDVATLFNKPMLLVNTNEWSAGFPLKKGDLTIIKHTFSRSRNRFLSVNEALEEPFTCQVFGGDSKEYVKVENTSEEIRDVVEEYLMKPPIYEYSELQKIFNAKRTRQIHRWLDEGEPFWNAAAPEDLIVERYRIASRADSVAGTVGQRYLEDNWDVDHLKASPNKPLVV